MYLCLDTIKCKTKSDFRKFKGWKIASWIRGNAVVQLTTEQIFVSNLEIITSLSTGFVRRFTHKTTKSVSRKIQC